MTLVHFRRNGANVGLLCRDGATGKVIDESEGEFGIVEREAAQGEPADLKKVHARMVRENGV
jgi:hypothetical protein